MPARPQATPLTLLWRTILIVAYVVVNALLLLGEAAVVAFAESEPYAYDWALWTRLPEMLARVELHDRQPGVAPFVYSPLLAPIMAAVGLIGPLAWAAVHVAAVFLVRRWLLIALILVAWPFWRDTLNGNVRTFVVVAGILALHGTGPPALSVSA